MERKAGRLGRLGELEGRTDLTRGAKRPYLAFNKIALIYEKEGLSMGKDKNSGIIKETIAVIPKQGSFFIVSK